MAIDKISSEDEISGSKDLIKDNIEELKKLFPEIVSDGKVDLKSLHQVLGEEIEDEEEFYRFTWAGKSQARREAQKPSIGTLRPCKEDSLDWDTTRCFIFSNMEVFLLKLLQKSYTAKVKMIYIDPPYNTGKDFIYKDNYKDNLKNYQEITGQVDSEGNKISTNSDSDGRFHSNWLNMMYPRLRLSKNLLKDDGIIFMSIDDNEVDNLKKIGNEIFGEDNFVSSMIWQQGRKSMTSTIATNHEYCLIYAKNKSTLIQYNNKNNDLFKERKTGLEKIYKTYNKLKSDFNNDHIKISEGMKKFYLDLPENDDSKRHSHYNNSDDYGLYFAGDISQGTGTGGRFEIIHPITNKPCRIPNGGWRFGIDKLPEILKNNKIHFGETEDVIPCLKRYLIDTEYEVAQSVFYKDGRGASQRLSSLFGFKVFDYPKDEDILIKFIEYICPSNDHEEIILDFFSGSSSSAHAVLKLNSKDGGQRKFIQIQLPEKTDPNSIAYKNNYFYITDIGKDRIRKVVQEIKKENSENPNKLDLGFKVFKLDSSNIKSWDGNPDKLETSLFDSVSNIKSNRTEEDILYEILLKYGLNLTLPIEERDIQGKKVFNVGIGSLFICLGDKITSKVAEGIGKWKEECNPEVCRVIFKDNGFTDVEKTNSVQILKRFGINEIRSI